MTAITAAPAASSLQRRRAPALPSRLATWATLARAGGGDQGEQPDRENRHDDGRSTRHRCERSGAGFADAGYLNDPRMRWSDRPGWPSLSRLLNHVVARHNEHAKRRCAASVRRPDSRSEPGPSPTKK